MKKKLATIFICLIAALSTSAAVRVPAAGADMQMAGARTRAPFLSEKERLGEKEAVSCTNGSVILVGEKKTFGTTQGHPQVCINNEYIGVCDELWGDDDASIICKQLGYEYGYGHCCYCVEDGTDTALNNVQCPSDAESIAECSATIDSDGSCLESNGAGVKCYSKHEECDTEKDVRIVGGDQDNEGQPQVCNGSNWNPICDESWDDDVATLFCKKLEYEKGISYCCLCSNYDGPARNDYSCPADAEEFDDCSSYEVDSTCLASNTAGVKCLTEDITPTNPPVDESDVFQYLLSGYFYNISANDGSKVYLSGGGGGWGSTNDMTAHDNDSMLYISWSSTFYSLPIGGGSYKSLFSPGKIYAMVSLGDYVYGVCGGDLCRINPVDKTKTNLGFGTTFTSVTDIGVKNSLLYVFKNGVYMINPITVSNSFIKPADYPGDPVAVTLVSATNEFAMLVNDIIYTYSPATNSFTSYAESLGTWEGAKSLRNKPGAPSYYLYTVKGDGGFYKIDLASKTATLLASGFSVNPTLTAFNLYKG